MRRIEEEEGGQEKRKRKKDESPERKMTALKTFFLSFHSPVGHENRQPHLEVLSGQDGRVAHGQVARRSRQLPLVHQSAKNTRVLPWDQVLARTTA